MFSFLISRKVQNLRQGADPLELDLLVEIRRDRQGISLIKTLKGSRAAGQHPRIQHVTGGQPAWPHG
jgi:hypothetical protein